MRHFRQKPFLMTVKSFEIACGVIAILGFFLVGGSMGGCDNGALSIGRAVMYCVIGLIMMVAGALGVAWFSNYEDDDDDDDNGGK